MALSKTDVFLSRVAPALLLAIWGIPVILLIGGSFLNLNSAEPQSYFNFVKFEHYKNALTSHTFRASVKRSALLLVLVMIASFLLATIATWALLGINKKLSRIILGLVVLPLILPPLVTSLVWYFQLNPQNGPIGWLLHSKFDVVPLDARFAFRTIVFIEIWRLSPFIILMFFTAVRSLEPSLTDTIKLYRQPLSLPVLKLYLRKLSPLLFLTLVLSFAFVARSFESIFVITSGGPGTVTETVPIHINRTGFQRFELGLAASQSILYNILLAVCVFGLYRYAVRKAA